MPLWSHQIEGTNYIRENPAVLLNWEMGTGKSRAVVEYVADESPHAALIVCPKTVIDVWTAEFTKFAPDAVNLAALKKGTMAAKMDQALATLSESEDKPAVVIVNYESVYRKPLRDLMLQIPWDLIVADEIQRIKSPSGVCSGFMARLNGERKIGLTGTPMPHSPLDVYAQYRFLDPSIFGRSFTRFKSTYAIMGGYKVCGKPVQILGYKNTDDLNRRFHSIAHTVNKEEVLDLPPVVHQNRSVDLTRSARSTYEDLKQDFEADVRAGRVTAGNALVRLLRLSQVAAGFVKTDFGKIESVHNGKVDALADIMRDLQGSEPLVVFCRFHFNLDQILSIAKQENRQAFELSGRKNELKEWGQFPGAVLAVQIQSGGVGIDLTHARYAVYFSPTYSLGDYEQSLARLHRAGQISKVEYFHLIATDTIDATIYAALAQKKNVVQYVIEGIKNADSGNTVRRHAGTVHPATG